LHRFPGKTEMREYFLIKDSIKNFNLNLKNRVVYTEAASNSFLWTPLLAACAGAKKVYAVTADSVYAKAEAVASETKKHAAELGVLDQIEIVFSKNNDQLNEADVITNLGFVRPIDKQMVAQLKPESVILLMWEPWEFRDDDIDIHACRQRNIPLIGTNERDPRLLTFTYVALTVLKLLLENNIEIHGSDILLLGAGHFIKDTVSCLSNNGARVQVLSTCGEKITNHFDAVICLEHENHSLCLLGENGVIGADIDRKQIELIIHICGKVDPVFIKRKAWRCVPKTPAKPGRMSFTTGYVGPKPVIDLHAAGLRVGQAFLEDDKKTLMELGVFL
jgi:hypothetical protein